MFYSHVYLRKNGRFGLVWLAATQSRVLSRRELAAVNVALTASNILEHVPGNLIKEANRPRRFSLYLSSQLMYGSVKILQKQWEFLLGDLTGLLKKFHPDISPTTEIDLIIARPEPVTLESFVPSSIKDKYYDPFFGVFKENMVNVQDLLAIWDDDYVKKEPVPLGPEPFRAELGSPHSVSDLHQIQILDHPNTSLSIEIPGEQDLPHIDQEHLAFIQAADQQLNLSPEELILPDVSRVVEDQNISQLLGTELAADQIIQAPRPVEETPAAKITRELPGTPKKSKRKPRDDGDGGRKKPRNLDAEGKDKASSDGATVESDQQKARDSEDLSSAQHFSTELQAQQRADSPRSPKQPDVHLISPQIQQRQENWLQLNSSLQLSPIPPTPSPVRKRQPHKLIIDDILQMSRLELKKNMSTSSDTCISLALPTAQKKDLFKEPGSVAAGHSTLRRMWTRNCKFGLRVSDPDNNLLSISDVSPLESPRIKRKETETGYETPAKSRKTESLSRTASMEKGRDISNISGVSQIRERSRSLLAQASDDSTSNISAELQHVSNVPELDRNLLETSLAPLPEEQEQIVSPVPLEVPAELQILNTSDNQQIVSPPATDGMQSKLWRIVHEKIGGRGNWTTFRTICPPNTTSRYLAITLFQELCWQVAKGVLQVRQDEPYGEIYIWESDENSSV